ncbi:magnesium transporter [Halorarum salinum]|uniref:Uncharacterized protein n=1 Tax=Halorarum salinum TaxID=2743089 RepID=A0A7D5QA71_9EURY|nr:hypothetical protein [Halobaculum salinum]QLG60700.1 hypothetical protein HUG12_02645 [Halobaculum salinum]
MTDTAKRPTDDDLADRLGSLDDLAREGLFRLHDHLDEVDDFLSWLREEIPSDGDGIVAEIHDLVEAVDEFEDIVAELDPEALAEAIDLDEIDAEDVRAVMDSEEDLDLRDLLAVLDLEGLWHATDVRDLWTEIRKFQEEADDVDFGGDDGEADGDGEGDGLDVPGVDTDDVGMDDVPTDLADDLSEKRIQSTVMDGVEEFRSSVLAARAELKEVVEENRERAEDRSREVHSRNPTAVSTLPRSRSTTRFVGRFSTVPRETRYSSAENKRRLYGRRLERETEEVAEDA